MDRFLTKEELENLQESNLLINVYADLSKEIKEGDLKNCEILPPSITDGVVLNSLNKTLHTKADFMYYIDIVGTNRFIDEAQILKSYIESLDKYLLMDSGKRRCIMFEDSRALIHINAVTVLHEDKYHHIIIFLMQNFEEEGKLVC